MARKDFTYQEEKDGDVAEYITENTVYYRRNWETHIEILTGADIPQDIEN